jgi:nitroimidazol reductase NimA-like FMN-containing flavoprotein (pyridoxamine 5'-phosphate oxidase superfamily)
VRARLDRADLDAVLDEALVCHLAVVVAGAPTVLPTTFGRDGDTLYLHGSPAARLLGAAAAGPVCVAVTLLDGVVYARTARNFSANYRSAVIYGTPVVVTEPAVKRHALSVIVEHVAPGSWDYVGRPTDRDLAAVAVLALDLTDASVKVRAGDPADSAAAAGDHIWAGVLPRARSWGMPVPAADLADDVALPDHIRTRTR